MPRHHHERSVSSSSVKSVGQKNRLILLLIELFVGAFGFDRMYMGCMHEGLLKLGLFIMGLILLFVFPIFGLVLILAWAAWAFFDTVIVVFNALTMSNNTPWTFGPQTSWGNDSQKMPAFIFAIFILLMELAYIIVYPMAMRSDLVVKAMKMATDTATDLTTSSPTISLSTTSSPTTSLPVVVP